MWPGNQTEPKKSLFLVHYVCCVWIWCDSVRDHNLPHHTQVDFVLPNVSTAHVVTQMWYDFLHCHLPKFKFLQFVILELFSCDVIAWRLSPWQYWCKINPPRHDITLTWSAFISPASLQMLWCQMLESRRPRVAPSEARSLGSLALRVQADTHHWEVFMYAFECCNKVEQQRAVKHKLKAGLVVSK